MRRRMRLASTSAAAAAAAAAADTAAAGAGAAAAAASCVWSSFLAQAAECDLLWWGAVIQAGHGTALRR